MLSATRPALSQAVTTARKGMLLAPQTTWDVLGSAFQTCGRLIGSQEVRDHFLDVMNDGKVINAQVVGQADLGFWRILGLYNDLNNPLFRKYDFDAQAFQEGARLALERFHDVQMRIQEDMHNETEESNDTTTPSDDTSAKNEDEEAVSAEGKLMMQEAAMEAGLVAALGGGSALADLDKIMKRTWEQEAEEKPESLVAELKGMVTPEYLKILEVSSKTNYLLEKQFNYTADSGEIKNIALLSARAELFPLHDDVSNANEEIDYNKPMSDPSLENPPRNEEKDLPVVAQIEVLYDVEQIFTGKERTQDDENKDDGSIQMQIPDGKSMPRTSVLVGVFEGWLHGDPDGNESVRWRLAFNRPAWEFNRGLPY